MGARSSRSRAASGMLIAERSSTAPMPLKRGQFMRLVFSLKAEARRYVDADAVVVREAAEQRRRAWGVQFVSLPTHVGAAIGGYVGDRITEAARAAGKLARQGATAAFEEAERDVTPADSLDATPSSFGDDGTPLRELYREALAQVAREDRKKRP